MNPFEQLMAGQLGDPNGSPMDMDRLTGISKSAAPVYTPEMPGEAESFQSSKPPQTKRFPRKQTGDGTPEGQVIQELDMAAKRIRATELDARASPAEKEAALALWDSATRIAGELGLSDVVEQFLVGKLGGMPKRGPERRPLDDMLEQRGKYMNQDPEDRAKAQLRDRPMYKDRQR